MKTLTILILSLVTFSQAAEFIEPTTELVFPEECSDWTRTRISNNPHDENEISIGYNASNGSAITLRIFDGQFGAPSKEKENLEKELEEISSSVFSVWQSLGASVEVIIPITSLPNDPDQLVIVHKIDQGEEKNQSITLIRYYRGRYLSTRFTTLEEDTNDAFGEFGGFLKSLRSNQKNWNPNQLVESTETSSATH